MDHRLSRARWLIAAASILLAVACGEGTGARHLVLVTVDTYRDDHFLADRGGVPLTPFLESFTQRGIRYGDASSVANCTSPGTAGILTGLHPGRSGVVVNSHVVPDELATLTSVLAKRSFRTAAFQSNPVLGPGSGFDRDFETFEWVRAQSGDKKVRGSRVTDGALAWVARRPPEDRFFLWVHYMEPHGPYLPPAENAAKFPRGSFGLRREVPLLEAGDNSGLGGIPFYQQVALPDGDGDVRAYESLYAAEVRTLDDELERLFSGLEEAGVLESAVVVLTSDHGEALVDDDGYFFSHSHGLTPDQLRVPLWLSYPGSPRGVVIERPVSTVDILPTVLELLGVSVPGEVDGRSLLEDVERPIVAQEKRLTSIREGPWQLIWARRDAPRLVNLEDDPFGRDLSAEHPEVFRDLARKLEDVRSRPALAESEARARQH